MSPTRAAVGAAALALVGWPVVAPDFWLFVGIEALAFALYAVSFNVLLGYGGMLSFGHAAFFGIGGYTVALLWKKAALPVGAGLALAPLAAAIAAAAIGYFCVRLTGIYFAMLTFAFQMLLYTVFLKSYGLTGGDDGITGFRAPGLLGHPRSYYLFTALVVAGALLLLHRVVTSPFGYALRALRANPTRTAYVGVDVTRHRWVAFVLAGAFAGLAGALFAVATGSVFPGWLNWTQSAVPVVMTVLGGLRRFAGPVVGAVVYVALETLVTGYTEYWPILMGAVIVLLVLLLPEGLTSLAPRRGPR